MAPRADSQSRGRPGIDELLELYFSSTQTALAILDPEFTFVGVNDAYARAHGQPADCFPGKRHFDLITADISPLLERVRDTRQPSRLKAQPIHTLDRTGRNVHFRDVSVDPIVDKVGDLQGLVLAEIDVTEKILAEQAAGTNSSLLAAIDQLQRRQLQDSTPDALLDALLTHLVQLTESDYGVAGELLNLAGGESYIRMHAIPNISRHDAPSVTTVPQRVDLTQEETWFGKALTHRQTVICNEIAGDRRDAGLPGAWPMPGSFLAVPVDLGNRRVGAVGLVGRPGGYHDSMVAYLQPLLNTYRHLLQSHFVDSERNEALGLLQDSEHLISELVIPAVENEHSKLIGMINVCYEEMAQHEDPTHILQLLEDIDVAVSEHFQHEEQLMQNMGHPEYSEHKDNHNRLLTTLRENIERYAADSDHDVYPLQNLLANWFGRHFTSDDLRLQQFFSARRETTSH